MLQPFRRARGGRRARLAPAAILAAGALALPGSALAIGGPDSGGDPAPTPTPLAHNASADWVSSEIVWQYGPDCVSHYRTPKIGSFVAFRPPQAAGITVGDSFASEISAGVQGTCSGALVRMRLKPPPGARLDPTQPVRCTLWSDPQTSHDVTTEPAANCRVAAVSVDGTIDLGQRLIPDGNQFEFFVPLRASAVVSAAPFSGEVSSDQVVESGPLTPSVALTTYAYAKSIVNTDAWIQYIIECVRFNPNTKYRC